MPTVTIVIPAFNAERYIAEALRSVCEQTFTDLEVLVIDDGSTDGTITIAQSFAGSLGLTILEQKNAGPSAARNAGILRARGRHCAFLDADDVLLPDAIRARVELLDRHPGMGLAITDIATFDQVGDINPARWQLAKIDGPPLDRLVVENFVTTSAVMAPTARLIEAGLFPEDRRVAEDYELWLKLAARWDMGLIGSSLVRYRYTSGSLSADKLFSARAALEVIEAFWAENPEYARREPGVWHRSLGTHLTNAGGAAAVQGQRRAALSYLTQSLRHDPTLPATWKWIAKTLMLSENRLVTGSRPRRTVATNNAH